MIGCGYTDDMLEHARSGGKDIHCIEGFVMCWTVKEEGIRINVGDLILE